VTITEISSDQLVVVHHGAERRYGELVTDDFRVHRSVFTDPAIFEDEMTRIFGSTWIYLLHESEIPEPFDFKTRRVGRRPVIVTRSGDGEIVVLLNRCSHRGTMLCAAECGSAKRFQCPYHGWTFDNEGKLVGLTYPGGYRESFDEAAYNLGRVPKVESYRGYVFCSLNPDVESVAEWMGPARVVFDWATETKDRPKVKMVKASTMSYRGNWKLQNDNNGDMYHVPFTHKSTLMMTRERYGPGKSLDHFKGDGGPMVVRNFGHGHKMIDQRPSIDSIWERSRPIPGREAMSEALRARIGEEAARQYLEYVGRAGINLVLYPNFYVGGNGSILVYEPVAVDRTLVHSYLTLLLDVPPEVNALRMRFEEDFINVGNRDDNEVFERIQEALTTIPEMEWVDVSRGWATDREARTADGTITGDVTDETGIRAGYERWAELMSGELRTAVRV
jgi:phenylpropionate dioxygenase-like ring-hydroxylating dioxygenase large terminal subunit